MKRVSKINTECILDLSPFNPFIGKSCSEINNMLSLGINMTGKSFVRPLIDRMISVLNVKIPSPKYEYKMIRVNHLSEPKNPTSFKITDYSKIIKEEWETSDFKKILDSTYVFFIVTHGTPDTSIFKGIVVHNFSDYEMDSAKTVWIDTRDKIREGCYDRFLTEKETETFFFKIHAPSTSHLVEVPDGKKEVIRSFWISKNLISKIINGIS